VVKKFLRGRHGASSYADTRITWIKGRTPTLYITRDGRRGQPINLAIYNTEDKLHALFAAHGLKKRVVDDAEVKKYAEEDAVEAEREKNRVYGMDELVAKARKRSRERVREQTGQSPRLRGGHRGAEH